jgi:hypothetical protein
VTRKVWRKPEVKTLRAGAAETAVNTINDDGDGDAAKNNS